MPVTLWFALPWRLFYRTVLRVCGRLAGPQPLAPLAVVAVAAATVAMVQAAQQGVWSTVVILGALCVFPVVTAVADAALSRASERAADGYAARAGYGAELARALDALGGSRSGRRRLERILSTHPEPRQRVADLRTVSDLRRRHEQGSGLLAA